MSLGEEGQQHKSIECWHGKLENEDESRAIQPSLVKELSGLDNTGLQMMKTSRITAVKDMSNLTEEMVCRHLGSLSIIVACQLGLGSAGEEGQVYTHEHYTEACFSSC